MTFTIASTLLVLSNYFGFVFLFLLLFDLVTSYPQVAMRCKRSLFASAALIALVFLPITPLAIRDLLDYAPARTQAANIKELIAIVGYPTFAIFGSPAVAPWYLPLSIPVALGSLILVVMIWKSEGRKWLLYFAASMVILAATGQMNIKRVLFLLPWLLLAVLSAVFDKNLLRAKFAFGCVVLLVACGWIGILSGKHYAASNLLEPWNAVSRAVANDAKSGATIVSENSPFFFYLNYELGIADQSAHATGAYLGEDVYLSNGYRVKEETNWRTWAPTLRGKLVIVDGPMVEDRVNALRQLEASARTRCSVIGEFHASPDPAREWKARFTPELPSFPYRTNVTWLNCP